jgi:hypothetical protein
VANASLAVFLTKLEAGGCCIGDPCSLSFGGAAPQKSRPSYQPVKADCAHPSLTETLLGARAEALHTFYERSQVLGFKKAPIQ